MMAPENSVAIVQQSFVGGRSSVDKIFGIVAGTEIEPRVVFYQKDTVLRVDAQAAQLYIRSASRSHYRPIFQVVEKQLVQWGIVVQIDQVVLIFFNLDSRSMNGYSHIL